MIEAFLQTTSGLDEQELLVSRLGLRLDGAGRAELMSRFDEVLQEFQSRPPDPDGQPWSVFLAVHRDVDRD